MSIQSVAKVSKYQAPRDIFITISLALYILTLYTPRNGRLPVLYPSMVLYLFLGLTFFKLITRQTPAKITVYSIWYLGVGVIGASSILYALDSNAVFEDLYVVFVSWVLSFSIIQYIRDYSSFVRIFSLHGYFPVLLVLYLLRSGALSDPGARMGEYEFGNANNFAIVMMISLCCVLWFMFYANRKYWFINISLAIIYAYAIALSGGRKYFLIPFIFLLLVLIFKYWRNQKQKLILTIGLTLPILLSVAWAVMNVPVLYDQIGVRFQGLFGLMDADLAGTDTSTVIRHIMIENGWMWFLQRPLFGYGLNNFRVLLASILGPVYAHNNYIELMVDLGMIGLLLYYSLYAYIIIKLISIGNDVTGIRNFFLAFMLVLFIFDLGAVTYQLYIIQTFIGLASAFIWLNAKNSQGMVIQQSIKDQEWGHSIA